MVYKVIPPFYNIVTSTGRDTSYYDKSGHVYCSDSLYHKVSHLVLS